ncbi:hypothetical protein D6C00_13930 [Thiohalobacter thiocyanaticus]|uniref:Uncharacterized protein n=1 Tax=Thiohalobacter thiocyanaticus TaxID=585455 RepID=A0A426QMD3_9GAMM|nr:hypothetical protein D6C00_13930 [Thiohalobacter thiocyanaticus]
MVSFGVGELQGLAVGLLVVQDGDAVGVLDVVSYAQAGFHVPVTVASACPPGAATAAGTVADGEPFMDGLPVDVVARGKP